MYSIERTELNVNKDKNIYDINMQREVRQRETARGLAWPSSLEHTLYFCWRGSTKNESLPLSFT
jgi:hypothetical protein